MTWKHFFIIAAASSAVVVAGCGGRDSTSSYTVSATVSGLRAGAALTLLNNGTDSTTATSNGMLAFARGIPQGGSYSVTVAMQPDGQTCNVDNGSGVVSASNVSVQVGCAANSYHVGGIVTGVAGQTLVLSSASGNETATLTVTANGPYSFNLASGSSFTIAILSAPQGESCVVANPSGTVTAADIGDVNVSCSGQPFSLRANVVGLTDVSGLTLHDDGGGDLALSTSGTFAFVNKVPAGSTYSVSILSQPTGHTCFAIDGQGWVANADVLVTVVCPWQVGYLATSSTTSADSNQVAGFFIDQTTGATIASTARNAAGAGASGMAVSPTSNFLYVTNSGDNTVSGFAIDVANGSLSSLSGSPFSVGKGPTSIAIDPQGKFAYVANAGDRTLSALSIDAVTGRLSPIAGAPYNLGGAPVFVAVSVDGNVFAGYGGVTSHAAIVDAFKLDSHTGALSAVAGNPFVFNVTAAGLPYFSLDPLGRFLYAVGYGVSVARINASSGILTVGSGTSLAGTSLTSVAVDKTGRYLYAAGIVNCCVGDPQYGIREEAVDPASGALSEIASISFQAAFPASPQLTGIDTTNKFLFASGGGTLQTGGSSLPPYRIDASTGMLTSSSTSTSDDALGRAPLVVFAETSAIAR